VGTAGGLAPLLPARHGSLATAPEAKRAHDPLLESRGRAEGRQTPEQVAQDDDRAEGIGHLRTAVEVALERRRLVRGELALEVGLGPLVLADELVRHVPPLASRGASHARSRTRARKSLVFTVFTGIPDASETSASERPSR